MRIWGCNDRALIWWGVELLCFSCILLLLASSPARSQVRASRSLRSMKAEAIGDGWEMTIEFEFVDGGDEVLAAMEERLWR